MESYSEMKRRQEREYSEFADRSTFAAYNNVQFREGMESMGLDPDKDQDKIYHVVSGVFVLKNRSAEMDKLFDRFQQEKEQAIAADKTGEGFIRGMFECELLDHEYPITEDLTETLDAVGLTPDEVNASEALKNGLRLAVEEVMREYEESM